MEIRRVPNVSLRLGGRKFLCVPNLICAHVGRLVRFPLERGRPELPKDTRRIDPSRVRS